MWWILPAFAGGEQAAFGKYDLGCALERNKASDCLGHDYDGAVRLGRAAVLYALKR